MKQIFLKKKKAGLDAMQSHPLLRTCFSQYQASTAALKNWEMETAALCILSAMYMYITVALYLVRSLKMACYM